MNLQNFNIHDSLRFLKRHLRLILTVLGTCVVTIMWLTWSQPKKYVAATVLEIGAEIPDVAFFKEVVSVNPTNWWSIGRYYETQYKIIKSHALLSKVSKAVIERNIWPAIPNIDDEEAYVNRLRAGIEVSPVDQSRLVAIRYMDSDKDNITRVCDTIADVYVEENLNRKLIGAKQAVNWLSAQMQSFKKQTEASERKLQEFREKHKIVSIDNPRSLMVTNITALTETLNELIRERIKLEARYTKLRYMVKGSQSIEDLFGFIASDLLTELKSDYIDLERKHLVLSIRYKHKHPEMIRVNKELEELKKKISMEVENEVQRLKSRFLLVKAEEDRVRKELEENKLEILEFDKISSELEKIRQTNLINDRFYQALSEKLKEADLSGLVKSNNIRIIDRAQPPGGPVSPRVKLNFILSVMIGLIVGVAAAFVQEYLDATYKTQNDVERDFSEAFLGIVPLVSKKSAENGRGVEEPETIEFVPLKKPGSTVAEMYRNIRTNLSFVTSTNQEKIILITSTSPEEGKTATSMNLAITQAQLDQKVLIIDADLRRPSVSAAFEIKDKKGFSSLLINAIDIDEAIHRTSVKNLDIIPSGPIPPNPAELLSTETLTEVFKALAKRYDKIIIDACPTIPISDTLVLSQQVDGVIYVIRSGGPHRNFVLKAKSKLTNINANIIGVILNGVSPDQMGLTDHYYYRYSYHPTEAEQEDLPASMTS